MQTAAAKCSASEGCTHFTLSTGGCKQSVCVGGDMMHLAVVFTVAGLDGMLPASQANTLWMCSGSRMRSARTQHI